MRSEKEQDFAMRPVSILTLLLLPFLSCEIGQMSLKFLPQLEKGVTSMTQAVAKFIRYKEFSNVPGTIRASKWLFL